MCLGKKYWNLKSLINCKLYQFLKLFFKILAHEYYLKEFAFLIEEITYFCDWIASKNIYKILL